MVADPSGQYPLPPPPPSKRSYKKIIAAIAIVVIVVAAASVAYYLTTNQSSTNPIPTPTPTLSPSPTPSPSPHATPTPSPYPNPLPTPTPTPSPSPTPSPTATPTPTPTPTPSPSPTPTPIVGWSRTYGGTGYDSGCSVVATSDGGYAIAGLTRSFGAGEGDVYLVKTDATGAMLWNKTYGGISSEVGWSMVQTSDGGYAIAGQTSSFGAGGNDVYLVKTDASGNLLWSKTYGGIDDDEGNSLVQTVDGGYAIAGYTSSFGAGDGDVYLVKTDASGNMLWSKTYGGISSDGGYSVVQTADGGYAIAGYTSSFGAGGPDVYLVKTDASGNMLWNKTYGEKGAEYSYSVVQTSDGGYAIAGRTDSYGAGDDSVYLVKTDANGVMLWSKLYGGILDDQGTSLVQTVDGGYAIAGGIESFGAGESDVYLVKTDSAGNMLWNKTYGGTNYDFGSSVVQTSDGGYAIAGDTESSGAGNCDLYLVKTDSAGNIK